MEKSPGLAQQQRTLACLKPLAVAHRLYLAGGGAVAIHFGHRVSRDIDLFSQQAGLDLSTLRDEAMAAFAGATTIALTDASLRFELAGVPVDVDRLSTTTRSVMALRIRIFTTSCEHSRISTMPIGIP